MRSQAKVSALVALFLLVVTFFPTVASAENSSQVRMQSVSIPRIHRLYVIGDSLTYGVNAFAQFPRRAKESNRWKSVEVNAAVGRSTMTGVRIVQKAKLSSDTAILVALGTNDMMSRRERWYPAYVIDQFMKAAKGRPVLWLNLEYSTTRPDWHARGIRFNRQLAEATSRWPNLTVADWDTFFVPKKKNRFSRDGVHLNVEAYRLRSRFMLRELGTWSTSLYFKTTTTTTTTTAPTTTTTLPPVVEQPTPEPETPPPAPEPQDSLPEVEPAPE